MRTSSKVLALFGIASASQASIASYISDLMFPQTDVEEINLTESEEDEICANCLDENNQQTHDWYYGTNGNTLQCNDGIQFTFNSSSNEWNESGSCEIYSNVPTYEEEEMVITTTISTDVSTSYTTPTYEPTIDIIEPTIDIIEPTLDIIDIVEPTVYYIDTTIIEEVDFYIIPTYNLNVWWYDSWYYWADSEPEWYHDDEGDYVFCYYGNHYSWDPTFWNSEGWNWYWSGHCGDYSYNTWWYYDMTCYTWWPYSYDVWYNYNDKSSGYYELYWWY